MPRPGFDQAKWAADVREAMACALAARRSHSNADEETAALMDLLDEGDSQGVLGPNLEMIGHDLNAYPKALEAPVVTERATMLAALTGRLSIRTHEGGGHTLVLGDDQSFETSVVVSARLAAMIARELPEPQGSMK